MTILIPARNAQEYIAESLLSAVHQAHIAQIIVVVNDSSDLTESIVKELAMKYPIIYLLQLPSVGIAGALNAGIKLVQTPYIARLDADDIMTSERISKQVEFMAAHPNVAILGSQLEYISASGTHLGFSSYPTQARWIKAYLSFGNPIAHPSVLIRASVLSTNPYNKDFEGVEDLALWIELSKSHDLVNQNEHLTKYRQHANQVSISPKLKYQEVKLRLMPSLFIDKNPITKLLKFILNRLKIIWIYRKIRILENN